MIRDIKLTAFVICIAAVSLMAQKVCPHLLTNASMIVNIEGRFVNEQKNRTSASIEWRHHNEKLDTFFVNLYDSPSFTFITAGHYR